MATTSKLTKKNQTTVPKAVTEALGMKPADQFLYEIQADYVILRARTGRLADMLHEPPPAPPPKRPPTRMEIDEAIGRHLAEEDVRIRRQWHESQRKEARLAAKK
jgi:bifunctional DNA-binding transcriptional regulator/antitoxin component of YhaV-PrlF toxin-antitoxin module